MAWAHVQAPCDQARVSRASRLSLRLQVVYSGATQQAFGTTFGEARLQRLSCPGSNRLGPSRLAPGPQIFPASLLLWLQSCTPGPEDVLSN